MQRELLATLIDAGIDAEAVEPMTAGMGSVSLWQVERTSGQPPLVARVFGSGDALRAERERSVMVTAAAHDVATPSVVFHGSVGTHPVLVTSFARGTLARDILLRHPERARAVGEQMGIALGRLNMIVAPPNVQTSRAWIDRGGPLLEPIRQHLDAMPNADRLVHLDFHPANVFLEGDSVSAVIDWENATAAPPHIDPARSRAILQAITLAGVVPEAIAQALADGIAAGHTSVLGPDPQPELSDAWAMAMTADDLESHLAAPDAPVGRDVVTTLRETAQQLIGAIG